MKNILFLCHRIPYPPNKGDKIRSYNILKHLLENNNVSVGFLVDEPKDLKHVPTLKRQVKNLFYDQIQAGKKKIRSAVKAFIQGQPITVPYFYSSQLQYEIDAFLDNHSFDTIICSSSPSAEYVFQSRHYKRLKEKVHLVMDFIDMDSQKWLQYAPAEKFPLSFIYRREASKLLEYEKRIEKEFDDLVIVSEAEKDLFQSHIPTSKLQPISNGVDLDFFNPGYQPQTGILSPSLVFTGAMDYRPNIDGAIWFAEHVFPLIRLRFPDISFYLVGSSPAPQLTRLGRTNGIIVTGFVSDIRDYIQQADVCVIPLKIARGIQNKVLEAMAMGKAIVSTPQAAEGLNINMQRDICIQKNAEDFANAVISLLSDQEKSDRFGNHAREVVERNYSWKQNLASLDTIINQA
jgi:sugar transferase (PEP-CTERM/EpsH1 system associated)